MISVDTNVIIRLLTGDNQAQFKKAETIFAENDVMITTTVIMECEWVLGYAYRFGRPEITNAFRSLFGLPNVSLQDPLVIDTAIGWHSKGMDFADAIHLAKSQDMEALITFDKKFIKSASKVATIPVKSP